MVQGHAVGSLLTRANACKRNCRFFESTKALRNSMRKGKNGAFRTPMLTTNSKRSMNSGSSAYSASWLRTLRCTVSNTILLPSADSSSEAHAPNNAARAVISVVCNACACFLFSAWDMRLHASGSSTYIFQLNTSMNRPFLHNCPNASSISATAAKFQPPF